MAAISRVINRPVGLIKDLDEGKFIRISTLRVRMFFSWCFLFLAAFCGLARADSSKDPKTPNNVAAYEYYTGGKGNGKGPYYSPPNQQTQPQKETYNPHGSGSSGRGPFGPGPNPFIPNPFIPNPFIPGPFGPIPYGPGPNPYGPGPYGAINPLDGNRLVKNLVKAIIDFFETMTRILNSLRPLPYRESGTLRAKDKVTLKDVQNKIKATENEISKLEGKIKSSLIP